MRRWTADDKLRNFYEDKTSGSFILAIGLFKILKMKFAEVKDKSEFLSFLKILKRDIKKHHPLLFQLHNLVDVIYKITVSRGVEHFLGELKTIEGNFKTAGDKIASNFLTWLNENGFYKFSVATLSYSGTVLNSLFYVGDRVSEVYIFRSCPNCEGEKMAKEASKRGLDVYLVNDFSLDYVLNNVDFIVSGCDAIFEGGHILNKAGTSAIFKLAKSVGKETVVLFDSFKIVREKFKREKILTQALNVEEKKGIKKIDLIFEIVLPEFISYYITDAGIFANKSKMKSEIFYPLSRMFSLW